MDIEYYGNKFQVPFENCCIYFVLDRTNNAVKIGSSTEPYRRLIDLQVANPNKLEMIFIIENVPRSDEGLFKEWFKEFKIRGEWFVYDNGIKEILEYTIKTFLDNEKIVKGL